MLDQQPGHAGPDRPAPEHPDPEPLHVPSCRSKHAAPSCPTLLPRARRPGSRQTSLPRPRVGLPCALLPFVLLPWVLSSVAVTQVGGGPSTAPPCRCWRPLLTRDPLLVSVVSFAEWLPWLLFGLLAGALLDRWDRRRVMWMVDAARFAVVGGLAVAVLLDQASIGLLAAVGFLLGTGQTLVDTGAHSILPALVSRDAQRLEWANG
ncbi:MAG TPA: MFS transporter, partial [Actinomycetota bacterium]|nr:MFS transporter [Actinomycetota bacterium]